MSPLPRTPTLLLLSLCGFGLAAGPGAHASPQTPRVDAAAVVAVPLSRKAPDLGPPAALPLDRRVELTKAWAPKLRSIVLPPALDMRLAPARPTLDNGARISLASGVDYVGPTAPTPLGSYWLSGKATDWSAITPTAASIVELVVPTEVGEIYALDCRAREYDALPNAYSEATFTLAFGASTKTVTSEGGHVLAATKATATTTTITLTYVDAQARPFHAMAFWGCEIGKAS